MVHYVAPYRSATANRRYARRAAGKHLKRLLAERKATGILILEATEIVIIKYGQGFIKDLTELLQLLTPVLWISSCLWN